MSVSPRHTSQSKPRSIVQNEDGSVAIIFSLAAMAIFMVTGLAVDVGRVMHAERTMTSSLDAAALAAAKGMSTSGYSDHEVAEVAERYFNANMAGHGGSYAHVQSFNVNVDRTNNSVSIDIVSEVPTIFGQIAGIDKIAMPRSSVAIYNNKDIEIGLQLDVTGSMCSPCSKISALKEAVAGTDGLLDILMPNGGSTNSVRIGLAPFAAGVNAGDYAAAVSNGRAGSDGCVYERKTAADQPTDLSPTGTHAFKVRADLRGASACPGSANKVVAMTDSKSQLRNAVNGLTTGGSTAGHLGASWAWGLVSPEWGNVWGGTPPAAYGDGRTEKYVILMTDGIYNTVGGTSDGDYGTTATQSRQYAQATCTAMKQKGIVVYTIGFQAPSSAKTDLRGCASDSSKFYDAADAATLRDAFRAIAIEINNLRLSS